MDINEVLVSCPSSDTRPIVAFQGIRGAFSEEAIESTWRGSATSLPTRDFTATAEAVASGAATHALIPIHNTTIGPVTAGCEAIAGLYDIVTVGEITVEIRLALLALAGATLDTMERIYSHPAALAQCNLFFTNHPTISAVEAFDTAGAAFEIASREEEGAGALASVKAAELYGLHVLARDVQDRHDNATRFAIVMRRSRSGSARRVHGAA